MLLFARFIFCTLGMSCDGLDKEFVQDGCYSSVSRFLTVDYAIAGIERDDEQRAQISLGKVKYH
jgi:hypothetical protein